MKNKILLITALLSVGATIAAAQQFHVRPTFQTATVLIPIECSDGQLYVNEKTLEKFNFFAGLTDSYRCSLSDLELERTRTEDYSLVCSIRNNEIGNAQFHMDCTTAVMQLLVDYIEIPKELLQEQSQALQQRFLALSLADLASLVKIVDQLWLQEPYLTQLEQLLIPVFEKPAFIQGFLDDQSIQELVNDCYNLNWKHLICPRFVAAGSLGRIFSTAKYPACHRASAYTSVFSPDGKYLATGSPDKTAKIAHIETGQIIRTINHAGSVKSVAFSPDGKYLATGSLDDNIAKITDIETGQTIRIINHEGWVYSVALSPDGKYVATGSFDNTAKITDIETGQIICTINHENCVYSVVFSPDGKYLVTGSADRTAKITDIETSQIIRTINHKDSVYSVVFTPDGKYLATGSFDNTAKITDIETGQIICTINHENCVYSVVFSPDGKYLVTGSRDRTAKITESVTGQTISIINHNNEVQSIAFSPDGKLLLVKSLYEN